MDVIINLIGIALFAAVSVWFWILTGKTSPIAASNQEIIEVLVEDGTYKPNVIQVKAGVPITLQFLRKDPTPCASTVIFDQLNLSEELPINQSVNIELTIPQSGEYEFSCQMGMYRGRLIVG